MNWLKRFLPAFLRQNIVPAEEVFFALPLFNGLLSLLLTLD